MTSLPRTYAVLLGCYPRRWRANGRGEELLAVLLDATEAAGRLRPSAVDCLDVGIHGVAERLRTLAIVVPQSVRLRIAQLSVIVGASVATFLMLFGELRIPYLSDGTSPNHLDVFLRQGGQPFLTVGVAAYGTWLLVLITYLFGAVRASRELALISVGLTLLTPSLGLLTHHQRPPGGLLAAIAVLGLGAAVMPPAVPPTARRRLMTAAGVLGLTGALIGWRLWSLRHIPPGFSRSWLTARPMFYWNPNGDHLQINRALVAPATWLLIAAAALAVAGWYWRPVWLPVVAFAFVPLLCLRLGTATFSAPHAHRDAVVWTCAVAGLIPLNYVLARRFLKVRSHKRARYRDVVAAAVAVAQLACRAEEPQPDESRLARILVEGCAAEAVMDCRSSNLAATGHARRCHRSASVPTRTLATGRNSALTDHHERESAGE